MSVGLRPIDEIQTNFLEETGVTAEIALLEHNLAPLRMRRDISMLGRFHKVANRKAPKPVQDLFSLTSSTLDPFVRAGGQNRHKWQIQDPVCPSHPVSIKRSIFGYVRVLNKLPADIVAADTVKCFQRRLQAVAKQAARSSAPDWVGMFNAANVL